MEATLERLHIDLSRTAKAMSNSSTTEVIDSWEDAGSEESDPNTPIEAPGPSLKHINSDDMALSPPPPTPISPQDWTPATVLGGGRPTNGNSRAQTPVNSNSTPTTLKRSDSDAERKRPEKTTATASRMIAASLGLKAPKKTEEQKQYDRAAKENEIKKRNREKEEKEKERLADEKAKAAMWDN